MSSPNEASPQAASPGPSAYALRTEVIASQLAVLLLVVSGFGTAVYTSVRHGVYRETEADLLGAAQLLRQQLAEGKPLGANEIDHVYFHRFGPAPRDRAYFAVWNSAGELEAGSDPLPAHVAPLELPPADGPRPYRFRVVGHEVEVALHGVDGGQILIGRPLGKEGDRLRALLRTLIGAGCLALIAGAGAGWWLARRIAVPLERLTETAERISARRLDQRLPATLASAELRRLSSVFNGMLERLQASFEQQVRFTADASHELRTPVAVILTQADHSLARPRSAEEYQASLDICLQAARGMRRLVDDLLLLSRADSGHLDLRKEPCDLARIADLAISQLEPVARDKQIRIDSSLTQARLLGDPSRLAQVVMNLLANAVDYSHPGGDVFVRVESAGPVATLTVADAGIGIPPESQALIFQRFVRLDKARQNRPGHGAGLGLCIASEIVAAHGGTIHVDSELGRGSTFTLQFPAWPDSISPPP